MESDGMELNPEEEVQLNDTGRDAMHQGKRYYRDTSYEQALVRMVGRGKASDADPDPNNPEYRTNPAKVSIRRRIEELQEQNQESWFE